MEETRGSLLSEDTSANIMDKNGASLDIGG
jgi:hypothetical protein